MKRRLNMLFGTISLLILGFVAFAACAGFGALIGFIFVIFPVWQIVLGTILGSVGVLLYLMEKK